MAHVLTDSQRAALESSFSPAPSVHAAHLGDPFTDLPLIEGRLVIDGGSQERYTLTATVPISEAPESWQSLLVPDDCRLVAQFGIGLGPQVKVATVWLDDVLIKRPDGVVELTAYSRATRVSQAGFPTGDRRYSGTTAQVVERIVEDCLGQQVTVVNEGVTGPTVLSSQVFDGDPWQAVEDLMDAAGGEAFFDTDDNLRLRPVPKANPPVSWYLRTGERGTITRYDVGLRRAPNRVRMEFRDPAGQADRVGTATATGNAAPTGPYGWYRGTERRDGRVSQADADKAAQEYLARAGGLMRTVSLEAVPHPGLEVGDVVDIEFVNGATETHRLTRIDLPLTPGEPMAVETRSLPW